MIDPVSGFLRLLEALDRLEIQYMVGGSAASSVHGVPRSTGDIDLVARIRPDDIEPLVEELQAEFYIDAGQIRMAVDRTRSFNVVHFSTSYKFDIFPLTSDRFQVVQFGRRRFVEAEIFGAAPVKFAVASPEDVILNKLRWYRMGGETSDQQWNDVLGVIAVQRERLDLPYLRKWADDLKISDLLEQALSERHEC